MDYDGKSVTFDRNVVLGNGATAIVFSGTWGNQNVAIKRGELQKFNVHEESTMKAIGHHQNVIDCFGILKDQDFIYMILELCDATVEQYCRGIYKGIVPPDYQALYQMVDGLHFIHSKNLAHRDISTGNVLIKLTGDKVVLKIADFGVCKIASQSGSLSMSGDGFKGTLPFIAPELLKQLDDVNIQESNESQSRVRGHIGNDIFYLGCVFYRLLTKDGHPFMEGAVKFSHEITKNLIKRNIVKNKQFLERLSAEQAYAKALIVEMIDPDKEKRPKLEVVKEKLNSYLNSTDLQSNCTPVPNLREGV